MFFNLLSVETTQSQLQINSPLFWFVMGIGILGTGIAIFAFLPQSLKTVKEKKTNSISFPTFFIYTLANILWFVWGILHLYAHGTNDLITILKDSIIITANIPCALWSGIILGIKIYNMYQYGEDCKHWKGKKNIQKENIVM